MGDSMMTALAIVGIVIGISMIFSSLWIAACLYQSNKRDKILLCLCGKKPPLYWKEACDKEPKEFAYLCSCGVQGYMGLTEEEAFYGWMLRGNREGYVAYITAKHGA